MMHYLEIAIATLNHSITIDRVLNWVIECMLSSLCLDSRFLFSALLFQPSSLGFGLFPESLFLLFSFCCFSKFSFLGGYDIGKLLLSRYYELSAAFRAYVLIPSLIKVGCKCSRALRAAIVDCVASEQSFFY